MFTLCKWLSVDILKTISMSPFLPFVVIDVFIVINTLVITMENRSELV